MPNPKGALDSDDWHTIPVSLVWGAFFIVAGAECSDIGKVRSPPFASSHERWGVCTECQRRPGKNCLVIVITLAVIMPVDGTVTEADALVAESSR